LPEILILLAFCPFLDGKDGWNAVAESDSGFRVRPTSHCNAF
jgi:hypothetical protein